MPLDPPVLSDEQELRRRRYVGTATGLLKPGIPNERRLIEVLAWELTASKLNSRPIRLALNAGWGGVVGHWPLRRYVVVCRCKNRLVFQWRTGPLRNPSRGSFSPAERSTPDIRAQVRKHLGELR